MKINLFFAIFSSLTLISSCNHKNEMNQMDFLKDDLKPLLETPKHYICYRTDERIEINGQLNENSWNLAEWSDLFVDIEGDKKPKPNQNTRIKMLWDDSYLYIAAELEEEHIWAYQENHDDIVFHDNDFEVFIDPDNDGQNYFEFEINAVQTVFDLFLPHPYRNSSFALHTWDFKGVKHAVYIDGTLNNGNDIDKKWVVELAIPFSSTAFGLNDGKPIPEKPWRINFSRVEWETEWKDGNYVKKTDANGKLMPENNWVWSPIGAISMHMPERYGYLKFSNKLVGTTNDSFEIPDIEKLKTILWAVFYRESKYYSIHNKFCAQIDSLGSDLKQLYDPTHFKLSLMAADTVFEAKLESTDGKILLYISHDGSIIEKSNY